MAEPTRFAEGDHAKHRAEAPASVDVSRQRRDDRAPGPERQAEREHVGPQEPPG